MTAELFVGRYEPGRSRRHNQHSDGRAARRDMALYPIWWDNGGAWKRMEREHTVHGTLWTECNLLLRRHGKQPGTRGTTLEVSPEISVENDMSLLIIHATDY